MKQIKNIRNFLLISLIAGGTWIGCDDANYSTLDTHVFFEEALTASSTKVTVMGSGETNGSQQRFYRQYRHNPRASALFRHGSALRLCLL